MSSEGMLSTGMEKMAGNQIQEWLERMTTKRLKAALFGTSVTALMQSSSLMMVTMIGLINANLMTLEQAIGMMLGDEIGTTITAQVVAFDIGEHGCLESWRNAHSEGRANRRRFTDRVGAADLGRPRRGCGRQDNQAGNRQRDTRRAHMYSPPL